MVSELLGPHMCAFQKKNYIIVLFDLAVVIFFSSFLYCVNRLLFLTVLHFPI